ncbi:MAG: glycosyltransferase family 2 protein [Raineya sp.]
MKIAVLTTMYHSEAYINEFYERNVACLKELHTDYEFIFVDDGSPDNSLQKAIEIAQKDVNVKVIELSRNFGHHQALLTALEVADADYYFLIDSDLEEAPELLLTYWKTLQENPEYDVIYGIQPKRKGNWFERVSGKWYYKFFHWISDIRYPADTLTARLMNKNYVQAILRYPEKELDLWCIFEIAGFKQKGIKVPKIYKGSSTYTLRRKFRMALNTITSMSHKPLYFIFYLGIFISTFAFLYILKAFWLFFSTNERVEGWTSLIVSVWAVGGLVLFSLGIIGIYLAKMFVEIKQRPRKIIRSIYQKQNEAGN